MYCTLTAKDCLRETLASPTQSVGPFFVREKKKRVSPSSGETLVAPLSIYTVGTNGEGIRQMISVFPVSLFNIHQHTGCVRARGDMLERLTLLLT